MGNVRGSRSEERRLPARTRAVSALTIMEKIGATTPMDAAPTRRAPSANCGMSSLKRKKDRSGNANRRMSTRPLTVPGIRRVWMKRASVPTERKPRYRRTIRQRRGKGASGSARPGRKLPASMARKETTIITRSRERMGDSALGKGKTRRPKEPLRPSQCRIAAYQRFL